MRLGWAETWDGMSRRLIESAFRSFLSTNLRRSSAFRTNLPDCSEAEVFFVRPTRKKLHLAFGLDCGGDASSNTTVGKSWLQTGFVALCMAKQSCKSCPVIADSCLHSRRQRFQLGRHGTRPRANSFG
jgi:hypothetical protein